MNPFDTDHHRLIVPRWRPFRDTASVGELASLNLAQPRELKGLQLEAKKEDWLQSRDIGTATAILEAATVGGDSAFGVEAADYILRPDVAATPVVKLLARSIQGGLKGRPSEPSMVDPKPFIGSVRNRLADDPRDSLLWVDLARLYSTMGQLKQATKAIEVALRLSPENRFVLRAAARLFIHIEEPDRAHDLLARAAATRTDTWLMASEIAIASLAERKSKFIRSGRFALGDARYSARDLTELAGAIGTEEAQSGSHKLAKKSFRQSLIDPNENAVAQASWAERAHHTIVVKPDLITSIPRTFEAESWSAYQNGNYDDCLRAAEFWLLDEPFSRLPAIHGSFVASLMDRNERAERLAISGLIANPNDHMLKNNLLVAVACQGRIKEAEDLFNEIKWGDRDPYASGALGLIASRSGELLIAVDRYLDALEDAYSTRDSRVIGRAIYYFFRELVLWSPESAERIAQLGQRLLKRLTLPEFRHYEALLSAFVESPPLLAHVTRYGDRDRRAVLVSEVLDYFERELVFAENPDAQRKRRRAENVALREHERSSLHRGNGS